MVAFLKPFSSSKRSLIEQNPCAVCFEANSGKYKCPRCSIRTCSMKCSKTHKESQKCDDLVVRWQPICGYSQFREEISIEDQTFMHTIFEQLKANKQSTGENGLAKDITIEEGRKNQFVAQTQIVDKEHPSKSKDQQKEQLTADDRFLLRNSQFRRIWLRLDPKYKSEGSRHERFSNTIFWACTLKFVRRCTKKHYESEHYEDIKTDNETAVMQSAKNQSYSNIPLVDYCESEGSDQEEMGEKGNDQCQNMMDEENSKEPEEDHCSALELDGENDDEQNESNLESISYNVVNIPETIRVSTLLRQFLRPKLQGSVISSSELDMAKMQPFISAADSVLYSPFDGVTNGCQDQDKLMVYLEVPMDGVSEAEEDDEDQMRYYTVDPNRTLLENLRNRHVCGHPRFVVVLRQKTEFGELELPMMSENEQKQLQAENKSRARAPDEHAHWHRRGNRGRGTGRMQRRRHGWQEQQRQGWSTGSVQQQQVNPLIAPPVLLAAHPFPFHPYQMNAPNYTGGPHQWTAHPQRAGWNIHCMGRGGRFVNNGGRAHMTRD